MRRARRSVSRQVYAPASRTQIIKNALILYKGKVYELSPRQPFEKKGIVELNLIKRKRQLHMLHKKRKHYFDEHGELEKDEDNYT